MIRSFGDTSTEDFFHGKSSAHARRIPVTIRTAAARKLDMVNAAAVFDDLRSPPGNRLEKLRGDWLGYHSIRINQQWRIVFKWEDGMAENVQIVDYHR